MSEVGAMQEFFAETPGIQDSSAALLLRNDNIKVVISGFSESIRNIV
jgi:hypothetical protein